ncbi:MAG: FKBP-type peptidyl-prolyl cis-trans isomerase [Bacteroidales bacterium]|nr:FKBP-type peptidyl-prolyl cis-trans isomerase [Bacteroidales bacterium]
MKYLKNLTVFALAVLFIASCDDSYKVAESGLEYKFYVQNEGDNPEVGDFITLDMFYGTDDTVLFDSKKIPDGLTFPLDSPYFEGDLFEGIMMMTRGDSASFRMSADSFYLIVAGAPELPPFIAPGSIMTFEVKLRDFVNSEQKAIEEAEALEARRLEAEVEYAAYIEANNITVEPLESGLIFIEEKKGSGANPKAEDMVSVNLTVKLIDGTKIFSTEDRGEPFEYQYGQSFDTKGLEEGVGMLRKGGKATLIVPQQIAYGAESKGQMIPSYSTIIYEVELVSMRSKEAFDKERQAQQAQQQAIEDQRKNAEKTERDNYLQANGITVAPTASGLYYIETEKGTGEQATVGKTVNVHYTGRLLDGTVFDSSVEKGQPFSFQLGVGRVIKGWDEAIAMMNVGGTATFIIPSEIGYGSRDSGSIPSYSTLVFDVELISVEDTQ